MRKAVNIADFRSEARRRLPRVVFDFLDGGAQDERSLNANRADFEALALSPRVCVDVAALSTRITLFGREMALPLLLSPVGLTSMFWPRGEIEAAKAAQAAGIGYCLSTNANCSIEEIRQAIGAPFWFQLYMMKDRELTEQMMHRAKAAGCDALVMTVDLGALGRRERDARNGFSVPPKLKVGDAFNTLLHPGWVLRTFTAQKLRFANYQIGDDAGFVEHAKHISSLFDFSVTWDDIRWAKDVWGGPLVIKGILRPDDARRAIDHGADGISVSNHGGRQLDGAPSAIRALPDVVDAVAGRIPVIMDSGVRRGADIVRARALGAEACMVGRAFVYALAARGPSGAAQAITMFDDELRNTMALIGVPNIADIDRSVLVDEGHWPENR